MMAVAIPCLALPTPADDQHPVSMRDVDFRGAMRTPTRDVDAIVRARIATPIGRIPVNGHVRIRYDCDASFKGTISYSRLVRIFARLKGIDLVSEIDGDVRGDPWDCAETETGALLGQAVVETTILSGWMTVASDSIPFTGPAWTVGDSTYHSVLAATRAGRRYEVRINLYER